MNVTVTLDPQEIADEVNEATGQEAETAESVSRWINDNGASMDSMLSEAIATELSEIYE